MRIGIYFESYANPFFLKKDIFDHNHKLIGYSTANAQPISNLPLNFIPDCAELLAGSEVLMICAESSSCVEVAVNAIRKGIHVFHCNLSLFSLRELMDIRILLQEISVSVGFGSSGATPLQHALRPLPTDLPIFADCKRNAQESYDYRRIRKMLTFDLGSLLRISKSNVRRVRLGAFPVLKPEFDLLSLRIELENGSILCYTLTNNVENSSFALSCFIDSNLHFPNLSSNEPFAVAVAQSIEDNLKQFLHNIPAPIAPLNIEMAIDLQRLLDTVSEKLQL